MIEQLLKLFRVLVPSWRFFDELGDISHLYYRYGSERSKLSEWILYSQKPERNLKTLLLNPQGNLYLANIGLITEPASHAPLLENLVRREIQKLHPGQRYFQFKADDYISELNELPAL